MKLVLNEERHPACQFQSDKKWIDCQYEDDGCTLIKKPDELEKEMEDPPAIDNQQILDRIKGSMFGMTIGDALGAHVEFRPRSYLIDHPVQDFQGGGTWNLQIGQFTDDTSMGLCLANSLIGRKKFNCYDQLVRYRWWYIYGYMSSTGKCFDIGSATRRSLHEFSSRQKAFAEQYQIPLKDMDYLSDEDLLEKFDVFCSEDGVAGNGALMRLAPLPLFFYRNPKQAVQFAGISGKITHGDQKAYDACRYYSALIVAALHGETKEQLLHQDFVQNHSQWFDEQQLHEEVLNVSRGSFKKDGGYHEGIRGKGYIINALEAALWAFWSDQNSFEKGVLAAVNLGDDTDTTAAIYGQLAGAFYGYDSLPSHWIQQIYAKKFIEILCKWILYEGQNASESLQQINHQRISSNSNNITHQDDQQTTLTNSNDDIHGSVYPLPSLNQNEINPTFILTNDHNQQNNHCNTFDNDQSCNSSFTSFPYRQTSNTNQYQIEINDNQRTSLSVTSQTTNLFRNEQFSKDTNSSQPFSSQSTSKPMSLNKPLLLWTKNDVAQWIQSFGQTYSSYGNCFQQNLIDGYALINFITDQILIKYGITNENHRQTILNEIQLMRNQLLQPHRYSRY